MPIAYEGSKPYIFVSYSHRDTKLIMRIIDHLQKSGYRVWFDGGIEAGSEWPEYIASHLSKCDCVLTFISDTFVDSQNCRRELNFALDLKKPLLNVYIEDVELTAGMRMQLGLSQAMFRDNFADDDSFLEALDRAKILENCREAQTAPVKEEANPKPEKVTAPKEEKHETPAPKAKDRSAKSALISWLCALLELAYCVAGPNILRALTGQIDNGFLLCLVMLIPHVVISVAIMLILNGSKKCMTSEQRQNTGMIALVCLVISTLVAVAWGSFTIQYQINGFLKFLISLGLNVLPTIVAATVYFLAIGAASEAN